MPKIILTDKEKVNLESYINFLVHNSNPCESCDWRSRMECCGCQLGNEYHEKLKKYDVADLLKHKEIKEYVVSSVKLIEYRALAQSLMDDICNLEKKISKIMDSVDLVKDSEKKSDDKVEFYCNNCKMCFTVPNDKCKIAFKGEGGFGLVSDVRKFYVCPKCTKICWCDNG